MLRALAAAWLAQRAPIEAREPAPSWDFSYTSVVDLGPGDPELLARFPCPEGSRAGAVPIVDCDGEEVCPTRVVACWGGSRAFQGPTVAWSGARKISEMVYVDGVITGPYAGWWPDGSPRLLGRVEGGKRVGVQHHWDPDGRREDSLEEGGLRRSWTVSPQGWLIAQRVYAMSGETARSPETWQRRLWWPDGSPRRVDIVGDADGAPVQAEWNASGDVLSAARMRGGRPTGRAYVRVGTGYAVERWREGRYLGVSLPRGEPGPPTSGDGVVCPEGAFFSRTTWPDSVQIECATLSRYALGPTHWIRDDGTLAAESLADQAGPVWSTAWCKDGMVWTHTARGQPEAEVSGACPSGGY